VTTNARSAGEDGVALVEAAFALPAIALVAWLVLLAGVAGLDHLAVQHAATLGARAAAASEGDATAVATARAAASPRSVDVVIQPTRRAPGETVVVEVRTQRQIGPLGWSAVGRSVARVEPRP